MFLIRPWVACQNLHLPEGHPGTKETKRPGPGGQAWPSATSALQSQLGPQREVMLDQLDNLVQPQNQRIL